VAPKTTVDLISARGGQGTLILHLFYPDRRAWHTEGIDAVLCFNLAQKVLVSHTLKAERQELRLNCPFLSAVRVWLSRRE
jgi:hypothetical protein